MAGRPLIDAIGRVAADGAGAREGAGAARRSGERAARRRGTGIGRRTGPGEAVVAVAGTWPWGPASRYAIGVGGSGVTVADGVVRGVAVRVAERGRDRGRRRRRVERVSWCALAVGAAPLGARHGQRESAVRAVEAVDDDEVRLTRRHAERRRATRDGRSARSCRIPVASSAQATWVPGVAGAAPDVQHGIERRGAAAGLRWWRCRTPRASTGRPARASSCWSTRTCRSGCVTPPLVAVGEGAALRPGARPGALQVAARHEARGEGRVELGRHDLVRREPAVGPAGEVVGLRPPPVCTGGAPIAPVQSDDTRRWSTGARHRLAVERDAEARWARLQREAGSSRGG